MYIFRPQATTKDGQPLWKKQYSKRTKRWHPEPVKEEKSFEYIPFLMASILKGRAHDEEVREGLFPFQMITQDIWHPPLPCRKAQNWLT